MITRDYNSLLTAMKNSTIANQSKITDFNSGSIILTIYEAIARIIEMAYIDTRTGYNNNLKEMAFSIFDFKKKNGVKATVEVSFSRDKETGLSVTIPAGTIISDGAFRFVTNMAGVIKANEKKSNIVTAQAESIGKNYNIFANTINVIESIVPAEITSVNNESKAVGGADEESETEAMARFKQKINGLQGTNDYGLKAGILSIEGVRSVGIPEHFPPKNNVYNFTIYVDDGTGKMTQELKDSILNVVNGDGTIVNSGLRAAGINFDILPAEIVDVDIDVTCVIYRTEDAIAFADIKDVLTNQINDLKINEDVVWTDLILRLRRISYITDVKNLKINQGQDNITISESQIARVKNINIILENGNDN